MSTIEAERTSTSTDQDAEEVARLVAMLDGEPECVVTDRTQFTDLDCRRPARWIGQMHCGHPMVVCDAHHRSMLTEPRGMVNCPCGKATVWSRDPTDAFLLGIGGVVYPISGDPPRFLPL